jgi:N-acetyl-anhydromuramyl-L-alanine amidase AmpD
VSTLPPLKWVESPNFSERNGAPISLMVIHDCEGGYAPSVSWFANSHSQVSAHIVLKEDGSEATQCVPLSKKAWHCVNFNSRSIGLEMAGFAKAGYSEKEWQIAADIMVALMKKFDIPVQWAQGGQGAGFCRHYDLGKAGGGHSDPTTDPAIWSSFVKRIGATAASGAAPLWESLRL